MSFDLERARRETPGCENVLHFNNAGASLMPQPVLDALVSHLQLESQIGGYEAAERERDKIENAYDAVASMLNCAREEIAVVENATRAWDMAFYSLPLEAGDRILTAQSEYASNYIAFLQVARKTGAEIVPVPNDEHGQISVAALRERIDERVKLIALTHVPTNGGLVNPAAAVGRVAREAGIPFLLDACQSAGQMPLDVDELGCDMLSATARKHLRGPRGIGFLYVRSSLLERLEPPFLDLHAAKWVAPDRFEMRPDARRFENWETNVAAKIGLGVAVDYARAWGLDAIKSRVTTLAEDLRARLRDTRGVTVHDLGRERCGIVTFTVAGKESSEIRNRLREQAVNVSVTEPAGTLLDSRARHLAPMVRASVHYYNTAEEIERFLTALAAII